MQPRIYVYKVTFVDQPYWYWGVHKEKKFDEYYMGSPVTNKNYWKLYKPVKEIIEVFDFSEQGYKQAQARENNLIKLDFSNPLCLNEHYGGIVSVRNLRKRWDDPEYRESHRVKRLGANNPQYGTRFIHNPLTFENKRLKNTEPLPDGWTEGARFSKLPIEDQEKLSKAKRLARQKKLKHTPTTVEEAEAIIKLHNESKQNKEKERQKLIEKIKLLYPLYVNGGFQSVVETGYEKSQANLVRLFSKYVPDFTPQMGKKRYRG